jgi:hypothetical protein
MNELRQQITGERGEYVRRDVYDKEHKALSDAVDARLKTLENSGSYRSGQLWVIGAIVVLVNLAMYFLGKK